jgi:Flp pilus assembly protein TadG
VEFALSLFFILLLVSGIVDLGRAFFTYMDLREAAQEGAVYGSVFPNNNTEIANRVKGSSNSIENASVNIVIAYDVDPCAGNDIQVTVEMDDFPITMPFLGTILGTQEIMIAASATDRIITPLCPP